MFRAQTTRATERTARACNCSGKLRGAHFLSTGKRLGLRLTLLLFSSSLRSRVRLSPRNTLRYFPFRCDPTGTHLPCVQCPSASRVVSGPLAPVFDPPSPPTAADADRHRAQMRMTLSTRFDSALCTCSSSGEEVASKQVLSHEDNPLTPCLAAPKPYWRVSGGNVRRRVQHAGRCHPLVVAEGYPGRGAPETPLLHR